MQTTFLETKFLEKQIRKQAKRSALAEVSSKASHSNLSSGFLEMPLRVFVGKGYRIYFTEKNKELIILLCGGDKSTQERDIEKAKEILKDFR